MGDLQGIIDRMRAVRAADKERLRGVVIKAVSDVLAANRAPTTTKEEMRVAGIVIGSAVAIRVADQLTVPAGLSADDIETLRGMRESRYLSADEAGLLDRLIAGAKL